MGSDPEADAYADGGGDPDADESRRSTDAAHAATERSSRLPVFRRNRVAWWMIGALLGAVAVLVVLAFTGTLVTAVFLYYVSRPVYRRLRDRLGRSLAAATALLALAVPVVLLVAYTLLIGLQEMQALAGTIELGPIQDAAEPYVDVSGIVQDPASLLENPDVVAATTLVLEGVVDVLPVVVVFLLHLFVALATTFYLLRDAPRLARWVRRTFGDARDGVGEDVLTRYGRVVDEDLSAVFFGNILNAAITAIIGAIVYNVLNVIAPAGTAVPYPALLGLLAGLASLIPVVGMKLVYIPVAALLFGRSLLDGDPLWFPIVFFGVSLVFVDVIPDLVLRPYVSGRNLHVGLVMIAYIVGPLLFGWYGLFLGPLLLVLGVHFARLVLPELLSGEPLRPTPVVEAETDPPPGGGSPEGDPAAAEDHVGSDDETGRRPSRGADEGADRGEGDRGQ